jgi:hypothetical protein
MSQTYRIPKLTDRDVIVALDKIRRATESLRAFKLVVHPPQAGSIDLAEESPEATPAVQYVLDVQSQVIGTLQLVDSASGQAVVTVRRKTTEVFDDAELPTDWHNHLAQDFRQKSLPQLTVTLGAATQKELRCDDLRAAMGGVEDTAWNRFRELQTEVLTKLGQTSQILLVDTERHIAEIRTSEQKKADDLRAQLQRQFEADQKRLADDYAGLQKELSEREDALKKQVAHYETREAIYVARKKAEEQLEQLKGWLKDSSLTEQTVEKRGPVRLTYLATLLVTAALTAYFSHQSIEILKGAGAGLAGIPWWQWLALTLKSVLPLAAFTTFAIYFIRWESAWAKQHSDEELRTRARVVDIGRSAWLLEAVRDAKEAGKELPVELLKELSRNLFSNSAMNDSPDHHPSALSDLMMEKLSSIRVRTPDGAEVEATRGKK